MSASSLRVLSFPATIISRVIETSSEMLSGLSSSAISLAACTSRLSK